MPSPSSTAAAPSSTPRRRGGVPRPPLRDHEARNAMVVQHLDLVHWVVSRMFPRQPWRWPDLKQAGFLGLVRACELFDESRGWRFGTYATWWIRQAVLRALAVEPLIRIPLGGKVREQGRWL